MSSVTVTEKYALCMLKEVKKFTNMELSIHLVTSMVIEMMLKDNLEIIECGKGKKGLFGSNFKIMLNAKAPEEQYNRIIYNYIKDMNRQEIFMSDVIYYVCYGKSGFSDKKYKEIINALKEKMVKDGLISLCNKKSLFGTKEVINLDDKKFDEVVNEIRNEFIEKNNLDDEMVLLASLLNSTNFLKNIVYKYEKDDLKNRLNQIKESDISKRVKIAREVIEALLAVTY